jgi:hypothetical protein
MLRVRASGSSCHNVACACLWQLVSVHQYLVEYHLSGSCASSLAQVSADAIKVLQDPALARRCRAAIDASVTASQARVMSNTQRQVTDELKRIHEALEEERVDPSTGYSVDAVFCSWARRAPGAQPAEVLIGVEVDGPSHYSQAPWTSGQTSGYDSSRKGSGRREGPVRDCRQMLLGGAVMKKRHLARFGYTVVSVPYWEWDALNSHREAVQRKARQRYLSLKLRAQGVVVHGEVAEE